MEKVLLWTGFILIMVLLIMGLGFCILRTYSFLRIKCIKGGKSNIVSGLRLYTSRYRKLNKIGDSRQARQMANDIFLIVYHHTKHEFNRLDYSKLKRTLERIEKAKEDVKEYPNVV